MTLAELAAELVDGCRTDRAKDNLGRLYAPDAVSVEAADMGGGREARGLAAIRAKHDWWEGAFIMHGGAVHGPFLHGDDRFAVIFEMDTEDRATGARRQDREVAVYHVAGGRIVREEFFWSA
jgi:ketosteroid isomerase-like protein